jgi:hypothetical protein
VDKASHVFKDQRQFIQDLWGAGFTIVRRGSDPFEIDQRLIPRGMSYQWNPINPDGGVKVAADPGWRPVPYSRHEGVFAPWGTPGDIEIGGLKLCERALAEVEIARKAPREAAARMVDDWAAKAAADGITGSVRVATQLQPGKLDAVEQLNFGGDGEDLVPLADVVEVSKTRTIETTVGIPPDMGPHVLAIFQERDRLETEVVRKDRTLAPGPIADKFYAAVEADPGAPWWPTLRAILLPIAADNVRANLKKGTNDDRTDGN